MMWLSVVATVGGITCILSGLGALSPVVFGVSVTGWLAYRRLKKATRDAAKDAHAIQKDGQEIEKGRLEIEEKRLALEAKRYEVNLTRLDLIERARAEHEPALEPQQRRIVLRKD